METVMQDRSADCPRCAATLVAPPWDQPYIMCPVCSWSGQVYAFDPLPVTLDVQRDAIADDATCVHHPTKQAEAVCAGTGDYICALCAVEFKGQTYSTEYVNRVGYESLGEAARRDLPRPDRIFLTMLLALFVPCLWIAAPVWLIVAIIYFVKMMRQRRGDALYRRLIGTGYVVASVLALTAVMLGATAFVVMVFLGI